MRQRIQSRDKASPAVRGSCRGPPVLSVLERAQLRGRVVLRWHVHSWSPSHSVMQKLCIHSSEMLPILQQFPPFPTPACKNCRVLTSVQQDNSLLTPLNTVFLTHKEAPGVGAARQGCRPEQGALNSLNTMPQLDHLSPFFCSFPFLLPTLISSSHPSLAQLYPAIRSKEEGQEKVRGGQCVRSNQVGGGKVGNHLPEESRLRPPLPDPRLLKGKALSNLFQAPPISSYTSLRLVGLC